MKRCPCCDLEDAQLTPLEAMTLGVAIGRITSNEPESAEVIARRMCEKHRTPFVTAMIHMLQKVQRK